MKIQGKDALKKAHKIKKDYKDFSWSEILKNSYLLLKIEFKKDMIETNKKNNIPFKFYKNIISEVEILKSKLIKKSNLLELENKDVDLDKIDFVMF